MCANCLCCLCHNYLVIRNSESSHWANVGSTGLGGAQIDRLALEPEVHQVESSEEQTPKWDYKLDVQEISWGNTL